MKEELFFIFSTAYSASADKLRASHVVSRLSNPGHFSLLSKVVLALLWEEDSTSKDY